MHWLILWSGAATGLELGAQMPVTQIPGYASVTEYKEYKQYHCNGP